MYIDIAQETLSVVALTDAATLQQPSAVDSRFLKLQMDLLAIKEAIQESHEAQNEDHADINHVLRKPTYTHTRKLKRRKV